jgi:hypothetical protein
MTLWFGLYVCLCLFFYTFMLTSMTHLWDTIRRISLPVANYTGEVLTAGIPDLVEYKFCWDCAAINPVLRTQWLT